MAAVAIPVSSLPSDLKKADAPLVTVGEVKLDQGPVGFKLVKVKKPDGTIVTVKRPIAQDPKSSAPTGPPKAVVPKPTTVMPKPTIPVIEKPTVSTNTGAISPSLAASSAKAPTSESPSKPIAHTAVSAPLASLKREPTPTAAPAGPGKLSAALPASTAIPTPTTAPAKKKWYSGISKGISNLNVDKIASTIDSIEQATTRIDAALSGKKIPPKTPAATASTLLATKKPVVPITPSSQAATVHLVNTLPKPAATGTTILVSTPQAAAKPNTQVAGSTQHVVVVSKPTTVSAQTTAPTVMKPQASNVTTVRPVPIAKTSPTSQTAPLSTKYAALQQSQVPVPGPRLAPVAPITRSIIDAPSTAQQNENPAQHSNQYPLAQPMYQSDPSNGDTGSGYTGLAEGALGGATMGVGGDMAYNVFEDYQSGDEVVDDDNAAPGDDAPQVEDVQGDDVVEAQTADAPVGAEEAGEPGDEDAVEGEYNPEEDEVVDENPADGQVDAGAESDEIQGDYNPDEDQIVEDDAPDSGEPVGAEDTPDNGQPEELEQDVAEDNDVDTAPDASDDDQNVGDDDDY